MADLYERARELQQAIKAKKAELKELEDEHYDIIKQIQMCKLTSTMFTLEPTKAPNRRVNAGWFREHAPKFYADNAHVSHPQAVSLMTKICGDYQSFQRFMRQSKPDEFDAVATISLDSLKSDEGFDIEKLEADGVITYEPVKSWSVKPRPLYQVERLMKEAGEVEE